MFKNNFKIKISLLIIVVVLFVSFFSINLYVINEFKRQLNQQVETVASIYHDKLNKDNIDSEYLLETLLPLIDKLDVPIIITTKQSNGNVSYEAINLNIPSFKNSLEKTLYMQKIVVSMDNNNTPLKLDILGGEPLIQIHYGDPFVINSMKWIPYIQFMFAFSLILLVFVGLRILLSSEKNYIYAGLSRETAHQLGTPISSLMGWLELLEKNQNKINSILPSMKNDLIKLKNISDKFNKIGSKTTLSKIILTDVLIQAVDYYTNKIPKTSDAKIQLDYTDEIFVKGDSVLLYWAFENIIKNSLESIMNVENGKINIKCSIDNENVFISFEDNGPGILRKNKNKIFNPGFSTKNRGWGIGLNLSKRIIEHIHKGSLILAKSSNNHTIFRVKLKLTFS